jgi:hypothetical protein
MIARSRLGDEDELAMMLDGHVGSWRLGYRIAGRSAFRGVGMQPFRPSSAICPSSVAPSFRSQIGAFMIASFSCGLGRLS